MLLSTHVTAHVSGSWVRALAVDMATLKVCIAIDNMLSLNVVLADRKLHSIAPTDKDLWWALHGTGPNFSIRSKYSPIIILPPFYYGWEKKARIAFKPLVDLGLTDNTTRELQYAHWNNRAEGFSTKGGYKPAYTAGPAKTVSTTWKAAWAFGPKLRDLWQSTDSLDSPAAYINFAHEDEDPSAIYGENVDRLRSIKAQVDSNNTFNQWITV
ncbi:hypothetical protein EYZ11_012586 [Aspergillus tanneri]|uniref:Berberine/berberine-like domain-containing protein n=1 Tax=Aspergillus tanneri TaxID=1220188 RepID=A0A4S3J1Z6_9EURO|nr:hypothetical protein EYZ11_012586 [Aspergillus tanneri]